MEMGQAYTFHQGQVTFTSKFYETNMVDIWLDYEQNMNVSSIWWGTIFADRNLTAMQKEGGNMGRPGKPGAVPAVSWWQVGDDVLAMTEGPGGERIDVHKMVHLGRYQYEDDFGAGWHTESGPSHEAIGPDGSIYSTANFYRDIDEEMMESKVGEGFTRQASVFSRAEGRVQSGRRHQQEGDHRRVPLHHRQPLPLHGPGSQVSSHRGQAEAHALQ